MQEIDLSIGSEVGFAGCLVAVLDGASPQAWAVLFLATSAIKRVDLGVFEQIAAAMPLRRVGVYVPGGRASYPSSVVMAAVPAAVAGVEGIAVASPMPPSNALGRLRTALTSSKMRRNAFRSTASC